MCVDSCITGDAVEHPRPPEHIINLSEDKSKSDEHSDAPSAKNTYIDGSPGRHILSIMPEPRQCSDVLGLAPDEARSKTLTRVCSSQCIPVLLVKPHLVKGGGDCTVSAINWQGRECL